MQPNEGFDPKTAAKKLLREASSGALATLLPPGGDPYCSLVNVATAADGAPLLLLSTLALHTKNILADPRASLMLDERKDGDPLEGARIMLMGVIARIEPAQARLRYLARHAEAEMFADFGDFSFYRMEIEHAHLVAGFGRIVDLAPNDVLTDIAKAGALIDAEADIVAHMNDDHGATLRLFATELLGAADGPWRCVGSDPEGLDLRLGRQVLRLGFVEPVNSPGALRSLLKELAGRARGELK